MNTFAELQSREIESARAKHKPINSVHEGYSVILEELDCLRAKLKGAK